jgi:hypothetical protein
MAHENKKKWAITINLIPFESTEIRNNSYKLWADSFKHVKKNQLKNKKSNLGKAIERPNKTPLE